MRPFFKIFALFGLQAFSVSMHAQQSPINGKVSGNAIAASNAVSGATVQLLKSKDSSLVKMAFTDNEGKFELEKVATGYYLVAIQSIGYQRKFSNQFEISNAQPLVKLPAIELKALPKELNSVTVVSQKQLIEQKIDKLVVNVDASPTNVGATALEVLEKSPGISVDKDGNISLKGKQGVVVLIDGKPAYLSGADLANMLRNMSSTQLDQIEIMTNPPAKYDASGNSGVLNIKTKKNKQRGFNGSTTVGYGQGVYPKSNASFNLNYRNGKFNIFSNYSFNYRENFQHLTINRNFREKVSKDLVSVFDQEATFRGLNRSHNLKLGADYFASKKTTIGIVLTGFQTGGGGSSDNTTYIANKDGFRNSITRSLSDISDIWKNGSVNLNLRHGFDSTGKELTADIDYVKYDANSTQPLHTYYYDALGNANKKADTLTGQLPILIDIYSAKADYVHPFKSGLKLEAGVKFSFVQTDNNARYDSTINNILVPDYNRSNHFIYKENINAAYVNFSKEISKKLSLQLGLRVENTHAKGNQKGNVIHSQSSFDTTYTQLFPTAYIGYKLNDKHQFSLNYGRRINRPSYEDLNPFVQFIDRYTYQQGNPYLKPQFSHNIELTHSFLGGLLNTTLNYTQINNIIQQVLEQQTATNETYIKQANIAKLDQFGIAISSNIPVKKWWNVNLYANVFNNRFRGVVGDTYVDLSGTTLQMNASSSFKLNKGWGLEVNGFINTSGIEGVLVTRPMGVISFGASKAVLNNKGTVRLNLRDPFLLQQFRGYSKYGDIDATIANRWDNRVVNVSFTYRFSKGKGASAQRHRSSVDEMNRVKAGNN